MRIIRKQSRHDGSEIVGVQLAQIGGRNCSRRFGSVYSLAGSILCLS